MTEDYVSFEVAKLLKVEGFPQEYDKFNAKVYNEEDYEQEYETQRMVLQTALVKAGTLCNYPAGVPDPKCYAPTLQMAAKWIRATHNIYIEVEPHAFDGDLASSYECNYWFNGHFNVPYATKGHPLESKTWRTYEEALNSMIEYCLTNLI